MCPTILGKSITEYVYMHLVLNGLIRCPMTIHSPKYSEFLKQMRMVILLEEEFYNLQTLS
jgi:hypothetical protein